MGGCLNLGWLGASNPPLTPQPLKNEVCPLPPSRPPKVFQPVFLQLEILGERVSAKGAENFFLALLRGYFFNPMCLFSKYSEFCGELKNV